MLKVRRMNTFMKNKKLILPWLFTIMWMVIIFLFSSQNAPESTQLSTVFTQNVIKFFASLMGIDLKWERIYYLSTQFDMLVRKSGHMFVYLILGLFVTNAFSYTIKNKSKLFNYSLLFCVLYSISDEIHQIFVPGRACRIFDILVDSIGILFGVLIIIKKKSKVL
jgi:VanZ family protein